MIFFGVMAEDTEENVGAEAEAPSDAEGGDHPFPWGATWGEESVERGEDGDAVRPGDIKETVVFDAEANRPSDGEGGGGDDRGVEEEGEDHRDRLARRRIGWRRRK